jgi:hypothetical protein
MINKIGKKLSIPGIEEEDCMDGRSEHFQLEPHFAATKNQMDKVILVTMLLLS